MAAAGGLEPELVGHGGQDAGLVLGLSRQQRDGALWLEIENGPQLGQDVQGHSSGTGVTQELAVVLDVEGLRRSHTLVARLRLAAADGEVR